MVEVVTYKELQVKYPEAAEDIQRLKDSKEAGITGNRILFFLLGAFTGWFIYSFIPSIL